MANQSIYNAFETMWQYVVAKVGKKADLNHNHDDVYYTESEIDTKIEDIKSYADTAANTVKDDLLNGAGDAYDTLQELGALIDDNTDAVEALREVAINKADKEHTHSYNDLTDKTHWVGLEQGTAETVLYENTGVYGGYGWHEGTASQWEYLNVSNPLPIEKGKTYKVIVDQDEYICVAHDDFIDCVSYADNKIVFNRSSDDWISDWIIIDNNEEGYVIHVPMGHNHAFEYIKISLMEDAEVEVVHQLDEKFIPDTIARISDIEIPEVDLTPYETKENAQLKYDGLAELAKIPSDWNQSDEDAVDYIQNRTHYKIDNRKLLDIQWDGDVNNCLHRENIVIIPDMLTVDYCKVSEDIVSIEDLENCNATKKAPGETGLIEVEYSIVENISQNGNNSVPKDMNGLIIIVRDDTFAYKYFDNTSILTLTKGIYFGKINYLHSDNDEAEFMSRFYSTEAIGDIELKQLDEEFIPDTIARTTYVEENFALKSDLDNISIDGFMTTSNPTGTGSFSMNRQEYEPIGNYSVALGYNTTARGEYSHAVGGATTAEGHSSHAEGNGTYAEGSFSHAEGSQTRASGTSSHAEGQNTIASGRYQHVQGQYNIEDTENTYAHIVGNGTYNARSNAHTLDWSGNAWYQGTIKVGGTSYNDASEVALKSDLANVSVDLSNYETKTEAESKYALKSEISNLQAQIDELKASIISVYSGSSTEPSNNTGEDGDIYLVV